MDRTVPRATSEEIQLYRSTMYSLLRSTAEVQIRTLEEVQAGMSSLMHPGARDAAPDISAFIYSALRLPACVIDVRSVILGQNAEVFRRHGYPQVERWQQVSARARRRRCFFDGKDTLACYIASRSDIEDVIPCLTAYQMEWNKMHLLLQRWPAELDLGAAEVDPKAEALLAETLGIAPDDVSRLKVIWGYGFAPILKLIHRERRSFGVRLLAGSLSQYQRATHEWWENIEKACPALHDRPVYFISSNTHSLLNVLTGYALQHRDELVAYIERQDDPDLLAEWRAIQAQEVKSSEENFLYYVMKKFQQSQAGKALLEEQTACQGEHGMTCVTSEQTFDVEAQVIELKALDWTAFDPRLKPASQRRSLDFLRQSDALILNIDYPLGLAAYNILSKVSEQAGAVLGVYVMGKSASLNARRGDVLIPNVVQDEHSRNTYLFDNCFTASDVSPYLNYGTVLDNQKAICVLGTFLQNTRLMDVFFRESYGDIEMEAGPYLSAVYEMFRPKRHPIDEIANLYNLPFDLGILHYVSDTPMSQGRNLGADTLSYFGMDSTYASAVAILRRIFKIERERLKARAEAE